MKFPSFIFFTLFAISANTMGASAESQALRGANNKMESQEHGLAMPNHGFADDSVGTHERKLLTEADIYEAAKVKIQQGLVLGVVGSSSSIDVKNKDVKRETVELTADPACSGRARILYQIQRLNNLASLASATIAFEPIEPVTHAVNDATNDVTFRAKVIIYVTLPQALDLGVRARITSKRCDGVKEIVKGKVLVDNPRMQVSGTFTGTIPGGDLTQIRIDTGSITGLVINHDQVTTNGLSFSSGINYDLTSGFLSLGHSTVVGKLVPQLTAAFQSGFVSP